jgi:hypothetical protein
MARPAADKAPVAPNVKNMYTAESAGIVCSGGVLLRPGDKWMREDIILSRRPVGRVRREVMGTRRRYARAKKAMKAPFGLMLGEDVSLG